MLRRTKIIATLGPASDRDGVIEKMITAGMDLARLNLSHDPFEIQCRRASQVKEAARKLDRWVGIMVDLQGPKIRIDSFREHKVHLDENDTFILDGDYPHGGGDKTRVGITYSRLPNDVTPGDTLLLDDGRVTMIVENVEKQKIICRVETGGEISNYKGINKLGGGLSTPALTEKDHADIIKAAQMGADYLAVSFPRSATDIDNARQIFSAAGGRGKIIAKIERAEALDNIADIIEASDAVMIARGDLGVEIGDAALPPAQKKIIDLARKMNRVAITATQMMESMIESQLPTRAEVFDVANAVLDGTDGVMLSAETSVGKHPDKVIAAMARICTEAESQHTAQTSGHRIHSRFNRVDEAISMAAMYVANHLQVKAIAALTESGSTPLWMSRISSGIPIYALTKHAHIRRRITLYRGVYPASFKTTSHDHALVNREAVGELVRRGIVTTGDLVVITKGDLTGVQGGTNGLKIVRVGHMEEPQRSEE